MKFAGPRPRPRPTGHCIFVTAPWNSIAAVNAYVKFGQGQPSMDIFQTEETERRKYVEEAGQWHEAPHDLEEDQEALQSSGLSLASGRDFQC